MIPGPAPETSVRAGGSEAAENEQVAVVDANEKLVLLRPDSLSIERRGTSKEFGEDGARCCCEIVELPTDGVDCVARTWPVDLLLCPGKKVIKDCVASRAVLEVSLSGAKVREDPGGASAVAKLQELVSCGGARGGNPVNWNGSVARSGVAL